MIRTDNAYRALGAVLSYNCTPYIATNVPNFGEVCAFSESSATPYVNAVWGARSNRRERQQRAVRGHHGLRSRIRPAAR